MEVVRAGKEVRRLWRWEGCAGSEVEARLNWCFSSHWVSHFPAMKSGCDSIECRIGMLVCIPVMWVSLNALLAFWSTISHEGAVTMILASRLSKSVVTVACRPDTRFVSTLIPLPLGKWKD